MDFLKFESTMIDYLLETLRKKKGKSYDDIAGSVYGTDNLQQSRLKLYRLRKPTKEGKQKRLLVDDFISICKALDESPVEILAEHLAKEKRGEL